MGMNKSVDMEFMLMAKGTRPGSGKAAKFLHDHVAYAGDDCLMWPFSKHPTGYATFGYLGEYHYAHRFMCELVHGPAPSAAHQAAHSCHKPGCVNPRHISWKTPTENMLDKRANGTASLNGGQGWKGKLSPEQVAAIRSVKGRETLAVTAARFGVTIKTIRSAQNGETYSKAAIDWKQARRKQWETRRRNATSL